MAPPVERLNPSFHVQVMMDGRFKGKCGLATHMKDPDLYFVRFPDNPQLYKFHDVDLLYLGLAIAPKPAGEATDQFPINLLLIDALGYMPGVASTLNPNARTENGPDKV